MPEYNDLNRRPVKGSSFWNSIKEFLYKIIIEMKEYSTTFKMRTEINESKKTSGIENKVSVIPLISTPFPSWVGYGGNISPSEIYELTQPRL
ncbi:hypothetical protein CO154_02055 [Candidatus Pacearchaeota archaeon CG_4_9_14_3_um_filter_31_7]|nr:MAG: hypothetical protein AUJ10_03555 [Candidatus Pacearchaeota archaeon CG1_02_31_27]PIN91862.1 MAG: hypothetical protein COU55_03730 [Candidatus Pacearchaeota archaeon CG10_big_fil_rev_8_21_14_0_10_31_59]PIZ80511.1 MAG: hypothetical protein COX99_02450 [Candidatus Pacearchaeota archaeon CG_4_10_14_0_2_um_filter_31_10]PJA70594.1 MAG: hypothetical protein CO154_02055 [Candidatus Pacearchaeota archaeon CG_4_9_14_3_um_filter_31_7]